MKKIRYNPMGVLRSIVDNCKDNVTRHLMYEWIKTYTHEIGCSQTIDLDQNTMMDYEHREYYAKTHLYHKLAHELMKHLPIETIYHGYQDEFKVQVFFLYPPLTEDEKESLKQEGK